MIGTLILAANAREAVDQIVRAERHGVPAAWATMFGAGGGDMIPVFAAAASHTTDIKLGTAIVHTWGRHPVALAQEAIVLDQLSNGRFRLGIGSTTKFYVERLYGAVYEKSLTNLREYLITLRALLGEGSAEFEGEFVRTHARLGTKSAVPVMGAALGTRSFELCGEMSDGAISWMCPQRYLVDTAMPALQVGADRAGRARPPLVAHVPIAVNVDRDEAHALAREQLSMYAKVPNYQRMFAQAGHTIVSEYTPEVLDDLVVYGSGEQVAAGLRRWRSAGMDEIIAHPLVRNEAQREASFDAIAQAGRD